MILVQTTTQTMAKTCIKLACSSSTLTPLFPLLSVLMAVPFYK